MEGHARLQVQRKPTLMNQDETLTSLHTLEKAFPHGFFSSELTAYLAGEDQNVLS